MKIHEYQAKSMMAEFGIPVPRGKVAATPAEARAIAAELGGRAVIKAQVYAGGRGKAGGIKVAASPEEAEQLAAKMIGARLVTHQTGPDGVPISRVLVEQPVEVRKELYLSIVIDSTARMPVMMASEAGGMDIEEVAARTPEKIVKAPIDPVSGYQAFAGRRLAFGIGLDPSLVRPAADLFGNLYKLFMAKDCSLAEINPLVVTKENKLLALDAKLNFDDNASFRHPELARLADPEQEDPIEAKAAAFGVRNFVKLDGNIGCMVNGAGLAMSVLDQIIQAGGRPANFLDIGTLNTTDRVVNAFKLFTSDPAVRAVLINIFGGMARVDVIANGLIEAHQQMKINLPIVVRLAGTNVAEGKRILAGSNLKLIEAVDLGDAAAKAVAAARGNS